MNGKLEWHRNKVLELASKGNSHLDISKILRISQPTVNRDLSYLRRQAKKKIKEYINQKLPDEYEKCLVGLTSVLKKARNTASNAKKQARENTNIIISKRLLWNETRITYSCYSDG
jgi:predicted transcriptional regulator